MFLNFNGEIREDGVSLLRADNRGFRYGDGLFETMLLRHGKVCLGKYHLERLNAGMRLLRLEFPQPLTLEVLEEQIKELCALNELGSAPARVRLTVFRGTSGPYNGLEKVAWYCLQAGTAAVGGWSEAGLVLAVFPDGHKACDRYSAIKSNNYLLSTQAGMYAKEQGLDDCVLLNEYGRVAETTIANIWWVSKGRIHTTPLSEGAVAGVMRRRLLERLPEEGYSVSEATIRPDEMAHVEEIFISNAIHGLRWVRTFQGRILEPRFSQEIYKKIIDIN